MEITKKQSRAILRRTTLQFVPAARMHKVQADSLANSIQKEPTNPKLFTNRAMARIKLEAWDSCINDCIKSIDLDRNTMKGFFLLAQAQLALKHPNEALSSALTAYERCIEQSSSGTSAVSALVLKAKKEKWKAKERDRLRRKSAMLRELEDSLLVNKETEIQDLKIQRLGPNAEVEEIAEIEKATRNKLDDLRSIFAIADPQNLQRRVCLCSEVASHSHTHRD